MNRKKLIYQIANFSLIGFGIILFILNIVLGWKINLALPLLFLILGAGFFMLLGQLRKIWKWAAYLYLPGFLLITFGSVFMVNVITGDWNSWAYAWLLLLMAVGIGLLLVNRDLYQNQILRLIGWGLSVTGITFFAIFGAITGGLFIQFIAPLLLVTMGLAIFRYKPILPDLKNNPQITMENSLNRSLVRPLIEPLSARELDVLRAINDGLSNQQIAFKLSVAPSTVKTHINNIYGKLDVQNRVQALNRASELGLFDS